MENTSESHYGEFINFEIIEQGMIYYWMLNSSTYFFSKKSISFLFIEIITDILTIFPLIWQFW